MLKNKGFTRPDFSKKNPGGFTIVEMVVVIPIVIIIIGTFVFALIRITGDIMTARASNVLAYSVQDALNTIEADAKISEGYLTTSMAPTTPQGFDGNTAPFNNTSTNSPLILKSYATTGNPMSSVRSMVYKSTPNSCSSAQKDQNSPLIINIVYFIKNGKQLWRRILMPADYRDLTANCDTPWQKPSCPVGYSAPFCQATDMLLIDTSKLVTMSLDTSAANIIKTTITANSTAAGNEITYSGSIRATTANKQ